VLQILRTLVLRTLVLRTLLLRTLMLRSIRCLGLRWQWKSVIMGRIDKPRPGSEAGADTPLDTQPGS
jgi:hypothetical protein